MTRWTWGGSFSPVLAKSAWSSSVSFQMTVWFRADTAFRIPLSSSGSTHRQANMLSVACPYITARASGAASSGELQLHYCIHMVTMQNRNLATAASTLPSWPGWLDLWMHVCPSAILRGSYVPSMQVPDKLSSSAAASFEKSSAGALETFRSC